MTLPTFADVHGSENPDLKGWFATLARTIAVDFDGVLHPYTAGWVGSVPADEAPTPGALDFLDWCAVEGYRVVVFSTRADHKEGLDGIWDWLLAHKLASYVADVTHAKPPAVAYVDDRAVPYVGDWQAVREGIWVLSAGRSHGAGKVSG